MLSITNGDGHHKRKHRYESMEHLGSRDRHTHSFNNRRNKVCIDTESLINFSLTMEFIVSFVESYQMYWWSLAPIDFQRGNSNWFRRKQDYWYRNNWNENKFIGKRMNSHDLLVRTIRKLIVWMQRECDTFECVFICYLLGFSLRANKEVFYGI